MGISSKNYHLTLRENITYIEVRDKRGQKGKAHQFLAALQKDIHDGIKIEIYESSSTVTQIAKEVVQRYETQLGNRYWGLGRILCVWQRFLGLLGFSTVYGMGRNIQNTPIFLDRYPPHFSKAALNNIIDNFNKSPDAFPSVFNFQILPKTESPNSTSCALSATQLHYKISLHFPNLNSTTLYNSSLNPLFISFDYFFLSHAEIAFKKGNFFTAIEFISQLSPLVQDHLTKNQISFVKELINDGIGKKEIGALAIVCDKISFTRAKDKDQIFTDIVNCALEPSPIPEQNIKLALSLAKAIGLEVSKNAQNKFIPLKKAIAVCLNEKKHLDLALLAIIDLFILDRKEMSAELTQITCISAEKEDFETANKALFYIEDPEEIVQIYNNIKNISAKNQKGLKDLISMLGLQLNILSKMKQQATSDNKSEAKDY
jgi:hypothetical protein